MASAQELSLETQSEPPAVRPFNECIRLAQAGCPDALGELYERSRRYLLLIANQSVDARLRAKLGPSDIVQETLLKAKRHFDRFEGHSKAELRAWLRMILLNCVQDANRRFQPGAQRDLTRERNLQSILRYASDTWPTACGETPSQLAMAAEQNAALSAAMARLPSEYRQVIVLRNLERRPFAAIGETLGRSADATRKLWLRAIDRLREHMGAGDESR